MHRRRPHASGLLVLLLIAAGTLAAQGELVIVKDGTTEYHRPACDVIRGAADVLAMSLGQATARGFTAHPDCDPNVPKPPSPPEPARDAAGKPAKPPEPIYVFVDAGGMLYHRASCRTLKTTPKKLVLDAAVVKKYWPCGVCKAPILPRAKKRFRTQ